MKKRCFVIMPFSKTTDPHTDAYWEAFFENFIKKGLEAHGYEAYRSIDTPNNITKNIVTELAMADLVLAVLTDGKPNVFYELGVRHSLRQGTIMILEGQERPFDVSNYGILSYTEGSFDKFSADLGRYLKVAEERSDDSPVADFLNQRITVSVNLAIGRLRQCVEIVRSASGGSLDAALDELRELQKSWKPEREQVGVAKDDRVVLHADPGTQGKPAEECWLDQTIENKSLYPMMKERRWGLRIAQIRDMANRLTVIAFEQVDGPNCMIVTEAHYYQENRPY